MDDVQKTALASIRAYLIKQGFQGAPSQPQEQIDCPDLEELVKDWLASRAQTSKDAEALSNRLDALLLSNEKELALPSCMTKSLANHSTNILSVVIHVLPRRSFDTSTAEYVESSIQCIVSSDAAKNVIFTNLKNGEVEEIFDYSSVVLHVNFHPQQPNLMVTTAMDGSVVITDLYTREAVQNIKDHSKYVVRSAISPNGHYLATISYDKSLHLYSLSSSQKFEQNHTIRFPTNPETILFLPDSQHLLYTRREDNHLHYLSLPSLQHSQYNLNERQDEHISFSIVCLTLLPSNLLSLQTDQNPSQILLLPFHSHERLKTLYTQSSQSLYSTPRHCWTPDGQHVVLNSDEGLIQIVNVQGRTVKSLKAHGLAAMDVGEFEKGSEEMRHLWSKERGSSNVRDVACVRKGEGVVLVSVGFDKRIRVGEVE